MGLEVSPKSMMVIPLAFQVGNRFREDHRSVSPVLQATCSQAIRGIAGMVAKAATSQLLCLESARWSALARGGWQTGKGWNSPANPLIISVPLQERRQPQPMVWIARCFTKVRLTATPRRSISLRTMPRYKLYCPIMNNPNLTAVAVHMGHECSQSARHLTTAAICRGMQKRQIAQRR